MLFLTHSRLNPGQMRIVETIGYWNELLVKSRPSGLVAANQKNSRPPCVERVKDSKRLAPALNSEFPHLAVLGPSASLEYG